MNYQTLYSKSCGAFLGLAIGDSLGFPAMYHRTTVLPTRRRNRLWDFSKQTDEYKINKFSLPFTHAMDESILDFSGTDDTEFAMISALMLLESSHFNEVEFLEQWKKLVVQHEHEIWSGISERASIENIKKGLISPATGNDNPHHFDDGAVGRAVPIGIKFHGDPNKAAIVSEKMASITNAEDGVYAAKAMAASIALAIDGASAKEIVDEGLKQIPENTWLSRKVNQAISILESTNNDGFAAMPLWNNQLVNSIYNYGNIAPETLAIAYAIILATEGNFEKSIMLSLMLPKQADSMPAMVGALAGAMSGMESISKSWVDSVDTIKGFCVPHLKGLTITETVKRLIESE
ncbi:ADP-ribosylglycohydrolase family protein [Gottfriedia sp. NPDC056225]|uniref:ADP-ribosylglycohydrolase family protein n=1 Tax=Gottfriedia sp. NPDC056225 TaxID=3345751 RepID=UPI0035DEDFC4